MNSSSGVLGSLAPPGAISPLPVTVMEPGGLVVFTAASVAAGDAFTLAVRVNGSVWGWGSNSDGQLGSGRPVFLTVPMRSQLLP
ncbi:hypothetical protein HUW62_05565 [Myxococcus sp. AM011]|uniref:hypothetical protein n=2 Tax=Myxococcus TaxID=32 RepID=UPI0013D02AB6|nr:MULTISPECIES: hypothetical protein [Myxococcus]NVJ20680.1 hypothetical protein [Myxococcus sp. AM011]